MDEEPSRKNLKLGPNGSIRSYEDLLELSLDAMNLQRAVIARADAAGEDRIVTAELKKLKGLMDTHHSLLNSPQAKLARPINNGPSIVESILTELFKGPTRNRDRPGAPRKKSSGSEKGLG